MNMVTLILWGWATMYLMPIISTSFNPDEVNEIGYSVRCLKNTSTDQISIIENYEQFSIYPDPANDMIIIRLENSTKMDLSIYGLDGKLILCKHLDQKETHINISDLPDGIYIASLKNSLGIMQKQIIKTSY